MSGHHRAIIAPAVAFALAALTAPAIAQEQPYALGDVDVVGAALRTADARPTDGSSSRGTPSALNPEDRLSYTAAFDALRRGQLEEARASARKARDRVLLGQVEFERMFHPTYTASYDELVAWLNDYPDLAPAQRVYTLALRRRPDGAAEPPRPAGLARTWHSLIPSSGGVDDPLKAARVAYNNGDLTNAFETGQQIGDWWVVGLAAWRLQKFEDSFGAFDRVAHDPTEDAWVRAGAAFWAARAAEALNSPAKAAELLDYATRWPATFYGQIALEKLGRQPVIEMVGPRPYQPGGEPALQRAVYLPQDEVGDVGSDELASFIQNDPRARRTVAFYEVGRTPDAQSELRAGLRTAAGDAPRRLWTALARAMSPGLSREARDASRIDATLYPMPDLAPDGGFVIEKAMVYAIARKETGFNARARSSVGAYGMMQVMPTTAAELAGDSSFARQPDRLYDPATNLRLGQAYVTKMLNLPAFQGDMLRMASSYNAGPGPMIKAIRQLGMDADPLLLIETIEVPQARDYVEKVVAAYWIYQRMMGRPLNTLAAVASGARAIPIALDYVPPQPAPVEIAAVIENVGVSQ